MNYYSLLTRYRKDKQLLWAHVAREGWNWGLHLHCPRAEPVLLTALLYSLLLCPAEKESHDSIALIPCRLSPKVPNGLLSLGREQRILSSHGYNGNLGAGRYERAPVCPLPTASLEFPIANIVCWWDISDARCNNHILCFQSEMECSTL